MNMDLKTFVEDSLVQICEGIKAAQERTAGTGAYISPALSSANEAAGSEEDLQLFTQDVVFDLAIEVVSQEGSSNKNSGKLVLCIASIFNAGIKGESQRSQESKGSYVSRMRFTIPVCWPRVRAEEDVYNSCTIKGGFIDLNAVKNGGKL